MGASMHDDDQEFIVVDAVKDAVLVAQSHRVVVLEWTDQWLTGVRIDRQAVANDILELGAQLCDDGYGISRGARWPHAIARTGSFGRR